MSPYVAVEFRGGARDGSLESAIHRWIARLEEMNLEVRRAAATIERNHGRRTAVNLAVMVPGATLAAAIEHTDPYVAIASSFREIRRQLLARR